MNRQNLKFYLAMMIGCLFQEATLAKPKVPHVAPKESSSSAPVKRDEGDFIVEKRNDGTTVKYKKKTTYDFEGANIDGLYNKPSGSYISNIRDVKGKSIIRIRENFDAEVQDSARLIK
jgi:hypothetical protein